MIRVLCNGVFDCAHYGHLIHLQQARTFGDELWVSITDDLHVNKGPGRPVYNQDHRKALIAEWRCVDKVITVSGLIEAIDIAKPAILVKGIDYRDGLHDVHEKYCRDRGIQIRYTTTEKLSATEMIAESARRGLPIVRASRCEKSCQLAVDIVADAIKDRDASGRR